MEEIKCEQFGTLSGNKWDRMHEQSRRVYSTNGLAPTVHTMGGGGQELKIVEPLAYDEQNGYLRQDGCVGTLTTDGSSPKHNNRIVEPLVWDGFNQQVRADSSVCRTITRNVGADLKRNGQGIIEPRIATMRGRNPDNPSDRATGSTTEQRLEIGSEETSNTLTTVQKDNLVVEPSYRIRKLTPNECGRLMGVKNEDCEKIAKNQSTSSQYHLYGDAICVSVLMAIFGSLLGMCDYEGKILNLVNELKQGD